MSARASRAVAACALGALSLLALLAFVHVAGRARLGAVDLSRAPVADVGPALAAKLARLDSDLLFTYAVSSEASMPRELRGVADTVVRLLRSIEAAGAGRVRVQILDPDADAASPAYLAGLGLAPFRARALQLDAEVERSVWSSLRIAYGAHGATTVRAVTPEVLGGLESLILAHVEGLEKPRRPRVALAAPPAYRGLRKSLRALADLEECDFDTAATVPASADLLFWIDPGSSDARHVDALRALVDRGGAALVAGSALRAGYSGAGVRFERSEFPPALLRELGLAALDAIALDTGSKSSPVLLRSIGADQDFRALGPQPNGTLLFAAPTSFEPVPARLTELGFVATALASSSGSTRLRPFEDAELSDADLRDPGRAARAPRLPLLELLAPDRLADPWRGSIVVAAASTPFRDEALRQESSASEALVAVLVRSLASSERIAIEAAGVPRPARIPSLSPGAQSAWRTAIALAIPALLAVRFLAKSRRTAPRGSRRNAFPLRAIAAGLALLALARATTGVLDADVTPDRRNGLAAETRAILAHPDPVRVDLVLSAAGDRTSRRIRETVASFAAASPALEVVRVSTSDLRAEELSALARDGVLPLGTIDERGTPRFASVVLRAAGRAETLSFPDADSAEHVEFRLAAAIARLRGAPKPRIAVAAGAPRLTPAEALEFQKHGLFAPGGGDVFGEARARLEANDFAVLELDPEKPDVPARVDALLCFQPRRDAEPLIQAIAAHLARGGRALLAAQHFDVRSRRTYDSGMALALWPQPQFADVDRVYFPTIGIELVRDLVLDELHGTDEVATQVESRPGRFEIVRERAASPLFVRAVAEGFDPASPILRGISELGLPSPSRLRWDADELARHGITARALVSTSAGAAALAWTGGNLPADLSPATGKALGVAPLAAVFEGTFPPPAGTGRLVLVGCSGMFRDGELSAPGRDNAQFLLNATGWLALPADLAAILARRSVAPSFGLLEARAHVLWRMFVVGAGPAALIAYLALRARRAA
ncbi:MAG TPA: Gldg family protein [Planctomycetota bacterium]|nr:Gldg family protein [Planctomycetota bacterium]